MRKISSPIAEAASSKTDNAMQPEDSENPEDATTRECSVQYHMFVSPLGGKNLQIITDWLFIFGFPRPYAGYVRSTDRLSRLILVLNFMVLVFQGLKGY